MEQRKGPTGLPLSLRISLLDIATLLYHVHLGAQNKETIGFEDANRSLKQLTDELAPTRIQVDLDLVESALWSANLCDEEGLFWSPHDEDFESFIRRLLRFATQDSKLEFDRFYNHLKARRSAEPK
jgi:hypothetical protein